MKLGISSTGCSPRVDFDYHIILINNCEKVFRKNASVENMDVPVRCEFCHHTSWFMEINSSTSKNTNKLYPANNMQN